jgi:hypothetical protein
MQVVQRLAGFVRFHVLRKSAGVQASSAGKRERRKHNGDPRSPGHLVTVSPDACSQPLRIKNPQAGGTAANALRACGFVIVP